MPEKPKKLSTDSYKGVRDFYPEDMAVQEYIFGIWKKTAESFGYEEYGASVLEPAELYKAKSGEEIVNEQTYTFIDRGGREVTLRPEMTPTAARMVAARRREFGLPLRWYSIPNLFRYEQPQRGRVREHWQLNVDIFGIDSLEADVEVISLAYRIMKNFGAKDEDFEIRINSRDLLKEAYEPMLKDREQFPAMLRLLDKKDKMKTDLFESEDWKKLFKEPFAEAQVHASQKLNDIMALLEKQNVKARFNPYMVRGFDYYTDIVFEIFDADPANRRSLFGGGRYDGLTSLFGADGIPAVGFGVGDVTIRDFLETHGLLPAWKGVARLHICTLDGRFIPHAEQLATNLRSKGLAVSVNLTDKKVGDQISWAGKHRIPFIVCLGEEEAKSGVITLKRLEDGRETATTEAGLPELISKRDA